MSQKSIRYTLHARQRMSLRGITERMVREAIEKPDRTGTGYCQRLLAWRAFPSGTLKVVYSDKPEPIVVITTIWD